MSAEPTIRPKVRITSSLMPMHTSHRLRQLIAVAVFFTLGFAQSGYAQELSLLLGRMSTATFSESSYTWQIDYRQNFYRNFAGSVAYLNEGHITGHHRDGTAFELWGNLPFFHDKIALSAGAGVYYYYDTQPLSGGGSANLHGTAPIFSLAATGYLDDRWFYRVIVNRTNPSAQFKANTAALGLGYWFGPNRRPLGNVPNKNGIQADVVTAPQITAFGGQSVVNTFASETAIASAVEYRQGLLEHVDLTAAFINEGDPNIVRRSGLAPQVWLVNSFRNDRISVGVGLGPYIFIDRKNPPAASQKNPAALAPLVSLTFAVKLSEHWMARVLFHRVTSDYNRDSDIFMLGLGYRWPR